MAVPKSSTDDQMAGAQAMAIDDDPMNADAMSDDDEPPVLTVDPKKNLKLIPKKGILKSMSSFDERKVSPPPPNREAHFDEMNILATYHPADKDYGHMKVDEPKTPYHAHSDSENEEGTSECVRRVSISERPTELTPQFLEERLKEKLQPAKCLQPGADSDEEDHEEETEEQREKRLAFEVKRKQHYNEFKAVKMAKQLIDEDEKELSTDDGAVLK